MSDALPFYYTLPGNYMHIIGTRDKLSSVTVMTYRTLSEEIEALCYHKCDKHTGFYG